MKSMFGILSVLLLAFLGVVSAHTQTFTDIGAPLTPAWNSALAWGDYDNDGDLDLIITGYIDGAGNSATILYRNQGGTFSASGIPFAGFGAGDVKWVDLNNDGYLDLIVTGNTKIGGSNTPKTYIYRNQNGIHFEEIQTTIPGAVSGKLSIRDFDNDGDPDVAITGSGFATIYRNDGQWTFSATNLISDAISNGSINFIDVNKDGWMDVFLTGNLGSFTYIAKLYLNNGNGGFNLYPTGIIPVRYCDSRFADVDNDGDPDLILSGVWRQGTQDKVLTDIYLNTNLTFTRVPQQFKGHKNPSIAYGDYDNNGWMDILTVGDTLATPAITPLTVLHYNQNGTTYRDTLNPILGLRLASAAWGDYDNDGDLDIALSGYLSTGQYRSRIYRNNINRPNTAPTIPTGLQVVTNADTARLFWQPAQDNETPSAALSYHVYLYNLTYQKIYLMPAAQLSSGFVKIPDYGFAGLDTTMQLMQLMNGQYEWAVQSVDGAWKGSPFSAKHYFMVTGSAVNTPPYFISPLPDTTLQEDFGQIFIGTVSQFISDSTGTLIFSVTSQPEGVISSIVQDSLLLQSVPNYYGLVRVTLTANDGEYTLKDTMNVVITPVNDPPLTFHLLLPQQGDTLDTLPDTLIFKWRSSYDPDSNPLTYHWRLYGPALDTVVVLSDTMLAFTHCQRLLAHAQYAWTVEATDGSFAVAAADTFIFFTGNLVSIAEDYLNLPAYYALHPNYPNPFNPSTIIRYDLPHNGKVSLKIYNLLGQEVRTLVNEYQTAGFRSVLWDGKNNHGEGVSSGIYFYRLKAGAFTKTIKMLLVK